MMSLRRLLPCLLLCLAAVWSAGGLCGEGEANDPATASDVWSFSKFVGAKDRRWVVEKEIDPSTLHGLHHGMVMYEVTRYPDLEPTPEQRKAADSLAERSFQAAKKHGWFNFARAQEDGFRVWGSDPEHFRNEEFVLDDRILDPDRPEFLIYNDTKEDGRKLSGFMYQVRTAEERGPQIGGPLTLWHYHIWARPRCMLKGVMLVDLDSDGTCSTGEWANKSGEMIHVWFLERPDGPFATRMTLTPEQRKQLGEREY